MLAGKLMPNPIPNVPWMDISMDFIMGLPEAQGYDAILVVCDCKGIVLYKKSGPTG